jgi:prepilin-type N-terminal cleavage/methylation domain-containing protein
MLGRLSAGARRRASDESGMTLIEVLVAMVIGMIVLLAAFQLLDRSFTASGQIADREDALQRGRQAMELMTRQLRSQVCVVVPPATAYSPPVVSGTDTSVTFYGSLSESATAVTKRTLTYDSTAPGSITQSVITGVPNTVYPQMSFTGIPVTSTLLTNVAQVQDGTPAVNRPVFKYYRYKAGLPKGDLELLSTPLAAADLQRVAVIKVAFRAFAAKPIADDGDSTVLEDDVFIRISDPTEVQEGPQCV